ncbi:dihydrolipoyl dehydrogenase family protein [Croceiramulus getboli]|nr:NAD(P)/FAD-dependent oxidoreductase [Flavobacteriaceae bacterium YJPT1-3]
MSYEHFDVFVIGTGTAGKQVATQCAREGLKVAIADHREYGGTCPNRGCDPKKVLVNASELIARTTDLHQAGITEVSSINWAALQEFKKKFVSAVPIKTEEKLKDLGIKLYHQSPQFLEENLLIVEGKKVTADKIVIATGRIPRPLHFEGAQYLLDSDDFLNLKELPDSMIFIGAGYVAMEFAHIAARCGVEVTVIERGDRILKLFDESIASHLQKVSEEIGIKFLFNAQVSGAEELRKNIRVQYEQAGETGFAKAEQVYNTSGRVPATEALDLEKGKVKSSPRGVTVNSYLQSVSNPSVYACGDVADTQALPLTPLSGLEGNHVAKQILSKKHSAIHYPPIPTSVYTQPQLASVGLSEAQAKAQKIEYTIKEEHVPDWFSVKRLNTEDYCYKTLVSKEEERILGVELLAPEASEMINLFSLAIQMEMTCEQFRSAIFAYPTFGSDAQSMI